MSAVGGFDVGDIWIRKDLFARRREHADEGIVCGVDDERGDGYFVDHVGGGGAGVVIVCAGKSAVVGGDAVVEVAEAFDSAHAGQVEGIRKMFRLDLHAAKKLDEKVILVDAVGGLVESVGGGGEVHRGTDGGDGFEFGWTLRAPFAREFENEIAAHGKSDECETGNAIVFEHVACDGRDVGREARVIERGSAVVHAAAVALVHEDNVHAGSKRVAGDSEHVLRLGGSFETVDGDDGLGLSTIGLPAAPAADLDARGDFDEALFGRWKMDASRGEKAGEGLDVSATEEAARAEGRADLPFVPLRF